MEKPRKINAKLLEVGKDWEIKIRSYSANPERKVVRKLILSTKKISFTVEKLKRTVQALQQKYPDKKFSLERVKVGRRIYWMMTRKAKGEKNVPVYFSTTLGKIFVPSRYVRRQRRLTNSVVLYRLRDLKAKYRLAYL
jgi:hypothetical protein